MDRQSTARRFLATLALASLFGSLPGSAEPLCIDGVNPQYFYFNDKTTALVGYTPDYICHIEQRDEPEDPDYPYVQLCNYGNYTQVINELAARHLNVLRIWVGLGHSPGGAGGPLPHEQPFAYDAVSGKWDLNTWNQTFFDRLEDVVAYAALKNVVVELTLFDAFSGDFRTSPWYVGNNTGGFSGFSDEWGLISVPGAGCNPFNVSTNLRSRQKALVEKVVAELNGYDNIYWELANEPELSFIKGGYDSKGTPVVDSVALPRIIKWHECMTDIIRNAEGTATSPKRHLIAANYHTQVALDPFRTTTVPTYAPYVQILTSHYVKVPDAGRFSATEKIRNYLSGTLGNINRVFGFNEGRPTPSWKTTSTFDYITPDEARAEAWEFMLSEGGMYNHYTTDWSATMSSEPEQMRVQLGVLADFLGGLKLRDLRRSVNNPPTWAPNLPAYGTARGSSNVYWGSMQKNGSTYVLYVHHSNLSPPADMFKAYVKPASITRLTTLDLQLNVASVAYTAQWINPSTGDAILPPNGTGTSFSIPADGVRRTYEVPSYSYDIALKITNGTTTPSAVTCAP